MGICTAISVTVGDHYFGRNLDYEHKFGEKVVITPRNYPFVFQNGKEMKHHYAMIGMALPYEGYPLYFDATNEKGLSMAGLNFPGYAEYGNGEDDKENIASFELIPWILGQCQRVKEAEELLKKLCITKDAFRENLPTTPLHWLVADKHRAITLEQTRDGLRIYENPVGVLTNSPTFDIQLFGLRNYLSVTSEEPENRFSEEIHLQPYSRGMGGLGLPGDLSSMSRFVRASFTKLNAIYGESEEEVISQFFHILYAVYQTKGCAKVGEEYEMTNYSSCCNTDRGIYYYTTYHNSRIYGVDMNRENLEGDTIITHSLAGIEPITIQNE